MYRIKLQIGEMMKLNEKITQEFFDILKGQYIRPVFQPIVSLKNGDILAYEALSRIDIPDSSLQISQLFDIADNLEQSWNLEKICRAKALQQAAKKPSNVKIFLNVDANVITDNEFVCGFTKNYLQEYGLKTEDIVFELTERTSVENSELFKKIVNHYKLQGFEIAIDDAGSGYSNLNRITCVEPRYIKLDMDLIRNIDQNKTKRSIVGIMSTFSKESGYVLIAEGIETKEELSVLLELGVPYGQGYLFQRPTDYFPNLPDGIKELLLELQRKVNRMAYIPSFFGTIETICTPGTIIDPDSKAIQAFHLFQKNDELQEICVVDCNEKFYGILTRNEILMDFGGLYGYNLNQKKTTVETMKSNALVVQSDFLIENVSKMAMDRVSGEIYDAVVVLKEDKFLGVVTIKKLLSTAITIQVNRATQANPLTSLPGNITIEEKINSLIHSTDSFAIMYLDLDNFKAYNDAYGFNNGDRMIKALSESMKFACDNRAFLGHIGGDDFVVITKSLCAKEMAERIVENFQSHLEELYTKKDWKKGCIISKNRNGLTEEYPIASLSIAIVTNWKKPYDSLDKLSEKIVATKKKAKKCKGNSIIIS